MKLILMLASLAIYSCSSGSKKGEPLKEFNGYVKEVTTQVLKVEDNRGHTITFDNREVTYVGGTLMVNDSVCVSYRGKLDNGTPSIIAELIPRKEK